MYPLIAGIILGGQHSGSLLRLFSLAVIYVLGMALTYALLRVVIAAAGLRFMYLSGCRWFSFCCPVDVRPVPATASRQRTDAPDIVEQPSEGGSLPGVFLMSALAGLIWSPCTTAPLNAILLYIAQSGNLWTGAGTLWLYAMGMGLPLIVVTMFGNRLLPKSGPGCRR